MWVCDNTNYIFIIYKLKKSVNFQSNNYKNLLRVINHRTI